MKIKIIGCIVGFLWSIAIGTWGGNSFVKVLDGQLMRNGSPYYYIGTNLWYGSILGSTGEGGNRERLSYELDSLKSIGIKNLRILAGADAGSKNTNSVYPCLQPEAGQLNDTLLVGLDYFLAELDKRDMVAVIYLNNAWEWSGGYGFYLKSTGKGEPPTVRNNGYGDYAKYASRFVSDDKAKSLFWNYVKQIVGRTNSITGKPYKEDPAIMAWQVCNEPRSFSAEGKKNLAQFIHETARIIKETDPNHLVSTGSEGSVGCENDMALYEQIHADQLIDYLTIHIWPANWNWCTRARLWEDLPNVYQKAGAYIDRHTRFANKVGKPLVIEEFGYPRDGNICGAESPTQCRDAFYGYILGQIVTSSQRGGSLSGCNFWGWGGKGRPNKAEWERGNDFLCDPPHEPQGWYSVFDSDSTTIELLKTEIRKLKTDE